MRFTKIIATIGPATCSLRHVEQLALAGVDVCRLNFAHGDYGVHGRTIENIKAVNHRSKSPPLGIMVDTKGPEVRTGDVRQAIPIRKGDRVIFTSKAVGKATMGKEKLRTITVDYAKFADDVKHARCILIDNGAIEFNVESVEKNGGVVAIALEDGSIGSRRHVNLPGAHISLPSFTSKDWNDIRFGIERGVDFFAMSFVRTGSDIRTLKEFLRKHGSSGEVIAKIETPQAVDNIDGIIDAADVVMVARGDLGAEVPFEDVPTIEEMILEKCRAAGRPVIVATQMLESMILSPTPTRAEATDIAFAAKLQTDATMLSGETATGLYPFGAVDAMDRILKKNERIEPQYDMIRSSFLVPRSSFQEHEQQATRNKERGTTPSIDDLPRQQQALAASVLATKLHAEAIIVISKHGFTAKAVSNCRPLIPIHAFVEGESVQRRLMLVWGIVPTSIDFSENTEKTLNLALDSLARKKAVKKGQRIVIVSDIRTDGTPVMTVQIRTMG